MHQSGGTEGGAGAAAIEFVAKWSRSEPSERAASHEHFLDLCRLLGQPTPASADGTGEDNRRPPPAGYRAVEWKGGEPDLIAASRDGEIADHHNQ